MRSAESFPFMAAPFRCAFRGRLGEERGSGAEDVPLPLLPLSCVPCVAGGQWPVRKAFAPARQPRTVLQDSLRQVASWALPPLPESRAIVLVRDGRTRPGLGEWAVGVPPPPCTVERQGKTAAHDRVDSESGTRKMEADARRGLEVGSALGANAAGNQRTTGSFSWLGTFVRLAREGTTTAMHSARCLQAPTMLLHDRGTKGDYTLFPT